MHDFIDIVVNFKGKTYHEYHYAFAMNAVSIKSTRALTVD